MVNKLELLVLLPRTTMLFEPCGRTPLYYSNCTIMISALSVSNTIQLQTQLQQLSKMIHWMLIGSARVIMVNNAKIPELPSGVVSTYDWQVAC